MNKNMRVDTNDLYKFKYLGNLFPSFNSLHNLIVELISGWEEMSSPTFMDIFYNLILPFNRLSTTSIVEYRKNFFMEYISKGKTLRLSSLANELLEQYGVRRYEYTPIIGNSEMYYTMSIKGFKALGDIISQRYYSKWKGLYDLLNSEYDALSPYDMKIDENTTNTLNAETTINTSENEQNSHTNSGSSLGSSNANETSSDISSYENSGENKISGFNSENSVSSDDNNGSGNSNENIEISRQNSNNSSFSSSDNGNKTSTKGTETIYERTNPIITEIIRKGNIGNITKQELIKQQREILQYQVWDIMFKDLNRVLTRSK